jgi:serine/threonine protein kinase
MSSHTGAVSTVIDPNKVRGTLAWLPPEVFQEGAQAVYDEKSDVYGYAMIIYEIFCRMIPFHTIFNADILITIIKSGKHTPEIPETTPTAIKNVLTWSWKENANRPRADQVVEALEQYKKTIQETKKSPVNTQMSL